LLQPIGKLHFGCDVFSRFAGLEAGILPFRMQITTDNLD
jgi:hypothetical protein